MAARDAISLPAIVSAPLSFDDARVILESLGGPDVPAAWRGAAAFPYRAGPGQTVVRLRVRNDSRVRPVWTVTGLIRGTEQPDDVVIVGNHRDAWVYGGVDPSSGSAALVELAGVLGELARSGWRPRRSLLFASWDAEEFALTSSTEWGEEHQEWLRRHAVAYLNVDSAASGPRLSLLAVPALNQVLEEVARTVGDPISRLKLAAAARDRKAREGGPRLTGAAEDVIDNRLGSGSDYTVFLNFLGVPVADLSFEGPYGVYHSLYDNHAWVATIGDPGFRYHATLVQFWGLAALRLAGADVVPLDYEPYARRVGEFAADVERRWIGRAGDGADLLSDVRLAASEMRDAASRFNLRRDAALRQPDGPAFANAQPATPVGRTRLARSRRHPRPPVVPPPDLRPEIYLCARSSPRGGRSRRCGGFRSRSSPGGAPRRRAPTGRRRPWTGRRLTAESTLSFVPRKGYESRKAFRRTEVKRQDSVAPAPKTSHTIGAFSEAGTPMDASLGTVSRHVYGPAPRW